MSQRSQNKPTKTSCESDISGRRGTEMHTEGGGGEAQGSTASCVCDALRRRPPPWPFRRFPRFGPSKVQARDLLLPASVLCPLPSTEEPLQESCYSNLHFCNFHWFLFYKSCFFAEISHFFMCFKKICHCRLKPFPDGCLKTFVSDSDVLCQRRNGR